MLDEANTSFVNGIVSFIRWTFYITAGVLHRELAVMGLEAHQTDK